MANIIQKYLQTAYFGQEFYQTIEVAGLKTKFLSSSGVPKGLRYHIEYNSLTESTYITVYGKVEKESEEQYDFYFNFVDNVVKVTFTIDPSQVEIDDYTSSISFPNKFIHMWKEFKNSMLDLEGSNLFSATKETELTQAYYANNCISINFNDVLKFDITKSVGLNKSNKSALSYVALSNPRVGLPTLMFWSYSGSDEINFGVARFEGTDDESLTVYNLFYRTSVGWIVTNYVSDIKVENGNWYEYKQNVEAETFPGGYMSPYEISIFKNNVKTNYNIKLPLTPDPNQALYEDFNNLVSVFDKPRMVINNDISYVEGDHIVDAAIHELINFDRPLNLSIDGFEIKPVKDSAGNLKYGLIGLKVKDLNDSRDYDTALQEYIVGREEPTPEGGTITTLIPMILEYKHLDESKHVIATLNGLRYTIDQVYGKTKDIYPEWMGDQWEPFIPLMAVKTEYINRLYGILINNYQNYDYFYNRRFVVNKIAFDPYFESITSTLPRFNVDISNNVEYVTERND